MIVDFDLDIPLSSLHVKARQMLHCSLQLYLLLASRLLVAKNGYKNIFNVHTPGNYDLNMKIDVLGSNNELDGRI